MSKVPDSSTWATGGDPMTEKQEGFIQSLANEKGVDVDTASLNKADASSKIEELKKMDAQGGSGSTTSSDNKQDAAVDQHPDNWATGGDDATQKQRGYIAAMAKKAGEDVNLGSLSKGDASKTIEDLKEKTGM